MEKCHDCKNWWDLCPHHLEVARGKAEFMDRLGRSMKKEGRQVACYGAGDSNWNSIETGLHGKAAIIR